jgi:glutathione S-transferase
VLAHYEAEGQAGLKILDQHLAGRSFVVGEAPTFADIDLYGVVAYAPQAQIDLAPYPNLQAWMKRVEALPGYGAPESLLPEESRAAT